MQLPFFFVPDLENGKDMIELNEDNSKHIVQVLRKQKDEQMKLTNGRGDWYVTTIVEPHKKHCVVSIVESGFLSQLAPRAAIAISLLKNASRFEWFLEKATELGISEIFPMICERTEKEKFRSDRMQTICISAMLQSQQCWLPALHHPMSLEAILNVNYQQKFIAHCEPGDKQTIQTTADSIITLIGPEGDFTANEIAASLDAGFLPVSLGATRLRTETAGLIAAMLMRS